MFLVRTGDGKVYKSTLDPTQPLEPLRPGQTGFSAKRVGELQAQRDAARMMNQALETFYANPDVIGFGTTVQRTLPGEAVQNTIELIKATGLADKGFVKDKLENFQQQRSFAAQLDVLTAVQTRAFTGAQMTDKERGFVKRTLPTGASPEEFISILAGRATILRLVEARERLGIRVGKADADVEFDQVIAMVDASATAYAQSSMKQLKNLSSQEVKDFLPGREHLVSESPDARLVDVNPLRFDTGRLFGLAARRSGRPEFIEEVTA